jgi:hypothetical protein
MNVLFRQSVGQRRMGSGLVLALLLAGLACGGCSRAHLTPRHGRAYREIFAAQDANPNRKGEGTSIYGLDSQEAAIIAGNYRRALSPKSDTGTGQNQLLTVNPNHSGAEGASMPSVPQSGGN